MGRPKGSVDKPRERYMRKLTGRFPDLDVLGDMAEQAIACRDDIRKRDEWTADPEKADGEFERVTAADRRMCVSMYQDLAKYLMPQLKATELSVDPNAGSFTVKINAPDGNS